MSFFAEPSKTWLKMNYLVGTSKNQAETKQLTINWKPIK